MTLINKFIGIWLTAVVVIIMVIIFAFYWYELRPSRIRKECAEFSGKVISGRLFGGSEGIDIYERCVRQRGLEK